MNSFQLLTSGRATSRGPRERDGVWAAARLRSCCGRVETRRLQAVNSRCQMQGVVSLLPLLRELYKECILWRLRSLRRQWLESLVSRSLAAAPAVSPSSTSSHDTTSRRRFTSARPDRRRAWPWAARSICTSRLARRPCAVRVCGTSSSSTRDRRAKHSACGTRTGS